MRALVAVIVVVLSVRATVAFSLAVETSATRLSFDPANGSILSLIDKPTGQDFSAEAAMPYLYEVAFVTPDLRFTSKDAARVTVRRDGDTLIVRARAHKNTSVRVTCRFRIAEGSPFILARISVRSDKPRVLASVRFPAIAIPLPLGESGADDAVLLPNCDGCLVKDPLANGLNRTLQYPGSASMQLLAAFDKTAGVYLACHDAEGHLKMLSAKCRAGSLQLSATHLPPRVPVRHWTLAYDVAVTTFRGIFGPNTTTWESAAALYRSWAVQQPWCRRTLAERAAAGDVPKWLIEPSLFYAFSLRGQLKAGEPPNRLPEVVQQADAWRSVTGGPVTFMLMSWEKRGSWVSPDYFPPFGGTEAFRDTTRTLHAHGHRTLVFLSGVNWTLHKTHGGAVIDDEAEFNRRGRLHAISDSNGQALMYGKPDRGVGQCARICAATPLAREILLGSSLRCHDLGIDCVQADQIVGGGLPVCFHPKHGHPPGGGNWCAKVLRDIFADIRREGKARDPDFAFAIEEPGEFFIQELDTYHARDYQQARWPRAGRGVVGVPLFTHVYHDFMHGYGGDSCGVSDKNSPSALYQQGMNLVCGKTPGVAVWRRRFDPRSVHEAQRRMLRSHFDLWRGPAHDFLVFGRRVPSPPLDVPRADVTFWNWSTKKKTILRSPSILHSAWSLPGRQKGWVFACIASQPVSFQALGESFSLRPGEAVFKLQP